MYVWLYVCMYVCIYVCMYVCMHVCVCVCIYWVNQAQEHNPSLTGTHRNVDAQWLHSNQLTQLSLLCNQLISENCVCCACQTFNRLVLRLFEMVGILKKKHNLLSIFNTRSEKTLLRKPLSILAIHFQHNLRCFHQHPSLLG